MFVIMIAGFIVVGAALAVELKYEPPFWVHAVLWGPLILIVTPLRLLKVIGHMKAEGHLGNCYLKGRHGDAANAVLTAAGHNLRLVLTWLRMLLRLLLIVLSRAFIVQPATKSAS